MAATKSSTASAKSRRHSLTGIPKQDHPRVREHLKLVRRFYTPKAIYETLQASDARREAEDKALVDAIETRAALLKSCKKDGLLSGRFDAITSELELIDAQAQLLKLELDGSEVKGLAYCGLVTLHRQIEQLQELVGQLFEESTEKEDNTIGRLP